MSRLSFFSGSIIVIAWIITMGYLLQKHYLTPEPVPAFENESFFGSVEAIQKWRDVEEYMLIMQGNRPVGASLTEIRQDKRPDTPLTFNADFRLSVKVSPLLPQMILKGRSTLDSKMQLQNFHAAADIGPAKFSATGVLDNNLLYLNADNNNRINKQRITVQGPISLAEAVRPALGSQLTISPGNSFQTPVIDPLSGSSRGTLTVTVKNQEEIDLDGQKVQAYRVVSALQDIETVMWVDAYGQTVKRKLVGEYTMEKTTREHALEVAPALSDAIEIPTLDPAEFTNIPIQSLEDESRQSGNSALGALRTLMQ